MGTDGIAARLAELRPRLREALVVAYGVEVGSECAADAVAWAWEHQDRLAGVDNLAGYLYRVGQSKARSYHRRDGYLPRPSDGRLPHIEPGLAPALEALTEQQRVAVVAVHGFGWTQQEVADLLGVTHSTVRTHLARALNHLRTALEVTHVD